MGVMGWVRPTGEIHAEGAPDAVQALVELAGGRLATERARVEGDEQFAIRGVSAGVFVVQEHRATAHRCDLRLEVDARLGHRRRAAGVGRQRPDAGAAARLAGPVGLDPGRLRRLRDDLVVRERV